jgi:hypothetical protein
MAVNMKMAVVPCSLVEVYLYQTTWRYNPEDSHLSYHYNILFVFCGSDSFNPDLHINFIHMNF